MTKIIFPFRKFAKSDRLRSLPDREILDPGRNPIFSCVFILLRRTRDSARDGKRLTSSIRVKPR